MNKQTIDLDVITGGVPQVLHVAQYDTGARTLEFNIYSSNNDLDLTGATAKISGRKADGLGFEYPATISDGVVVADCTDQMTAVAGIVECAITLTNSEGQIQTARFDLNVKPAPLNDDTVISDSDFPLIQRAVTAEEDAEAWAVGTRNGEPVPVSDPTHENNAKYWAEQAEQTDIGQVNKEIADIWKANGVLGAKNLIPYPYYRASGYTHNGITSIYDEDGVITVNGTAVNSTARFAVFNSATSSIALKPNTDYILSIELQNATNTSIFLANNSVDMAAIRNKATGYYERKFRTPATLGTLIVGLYWDIGVTETNAIVKPMIRLAEDTDDTYQPHAMTNRELTEDMRAIECDKTTAGTYTLQCVVDSSGNKTYSWV